MGSSGPSEDYGRTPPQDLAAEQSVLGGMLLSKDAIADVIEVLRGNDFYRPAHETVYEAILDLYGRGEPADAVTVAAELTKRGELGQIGGAAYLHTLLSSVPTAANAGYYARIVRERAVLRRLVTAGTRIVQLGYATDGGDVDEIVNARAGRGVRGHRAAHVARTTCPSREIIEGGDRRDRGLQPPGRRADRHPDRLRRPRPADQRPPLRSDDRRSRPGRRSARRSPSTPRCPPPAAGPRWVRSRSATWCMAADGRPTRVVGATEVMTGRPCYEVHFSDGSVIVADAQHQWLTETRAIAQVRPAGADGLQRVPQPAHLRRGTDHRGDRRDRLAQAADVGCVGAEPRASRRALGRARARRLDGDASRLTRVRPRAHGSGDGHDRAPCRITRCDPEIPCRSSASRGCERFHRHAAGATCGHAAALRPQRPSRHPRCPDCGGARPACAVQAAATTTAPSGAAAHARASSVTSTSPPPTCVRPRDSAAPCSPACSTPTERSHPSGVVQFAVTNRGSPTTSRARHRPRLPVAAVDQARRGPDRRRRPATRSLSARDDDVFRLERKRLLHKERRAAVHRAADVALHHRRRPIASVPVRCVQVDNDDHLYLAGRSMIPTHNSTLGARHRACGVDQAQMPTVIFSLEMGRNEITMRLLSAEARIPLHEHAQRAR